MELQEFSFLINWNHSIETLLVPLSEMLSERSYEIVFYALFNRDHYLVQYGLIKVCTLLFLCSVLLPVLFWIQCRLCSGTALQKKHVILFFKHKHFQKIWLQKKPSDAQPFSLWRHRWQTIKIEVNFLCDSLLHRNKRILTKDFQTFFVK